MSVRLDLAALPAALEYFLNTSQWLDASATGVERALPNSWMRCDAPWEALPRRRPTQPPAQPWRGRAPAAERVLPGRGALAGHVRC